MEEPATCFGKVPCREHSTEFWNINGRCICEPCAVGFKAYGFGSVLPKNILFAPKKVLVSCSPVLLDQLKGIPRGDGRFDSMGHSAKYGTYTMFSFDLMKIVHFDILQVSNIIMICLPHLNLAPAYTIYSPLLIWQTA